MPKAPKNKSVIRFQLYQNNKNQELTLFQRAIILTLVENECSQRQVAWTMGISPSTVSKIMKKFKETGKIDDLPRSGRPKIFSSDEEKLICEMIIPRQCETAVDVHAKFCCETNKEMSVKTIQNVLRRNGYISRVKKRQEGYFTDESRFLLFGAFKGHDTLADEHIIPTKKFGGGSIMIWGCMTSEGGHIELVERTLNSAGYINILEDCLLDVLESCEYDKDEMIFQHNNARIYTSIATKA
ncbi:12734_t:CDS:2 [Racocetra fulgida]|uniref:12734_t:CDS:1 n=1 Tax=Racocetra fulgida TaxID=60492 RepID=A0A9N9FMB0_9GLOM|nr:12734_t:CDS:2 [Racocetra fulgida]